MAAAPATPRRFAFIFPMASGHINPSLPVARALVHVGHEVHYLCSEQMREAIEDTGASFHSDVEHEPELYRGRKPDIVPSLVLREEYGLEGCSFLEVKAHLRFVSMDLQMPGVCRWLEEVRPDAILYDPLANDEAAYAAKFMNIPSIALLTTAGPGSISKAIEVFLKVCQCIPESLLQVLDTYEPHLAATQRLNSTYALDLSTRDALSIEPLGYLPQLRHSVMTVVTTSEELQDPMPELLRQTYHKNGVAFETVGPLLDVEGACRAGGHKMHQEACGMGTDKLATSTDAEPVTAVRRARAAGRQVVLVSMGTVITGDGMLGWHHREVSADGVHPGLTGCELCRGAWGGAFDAFGRSQAEEGPLVLVALGPQPDALGPLELPANCIAMPMLPQVDLLKAGVQLFLTHGGQNSFMEALAQGIPVVVCPGFGDQVENAAKAERLGVGLRVSRPRPAVEEVERAAQQYRVDVAQALSTVCKQEHFKVAATQCMEGLRHAGGVPRVVDIMLNAAADSATSTRKVEQCAASVCQSTAAVAGA